MHNITSYLGFAATGLFISAFVIFATLTPGFDWWNDYISMLGARQQPLGLWWNVTGFISVGILLAAFGWGFGRVVSDRWIAICLAAAGLGFALAAIPTDLARAEAVMSKAHFVSICLSLAGWCGALARLGQVGLVDKMLRRSANVAGMLVVLPMIATVAEWIAAPVAHRLVLCVLFGWIVFTSIRFIAMDEAR